MDAESGTEPTHPRGEALIGPLATFASPALEAAFRQRHFRDDRCLFMLLVAAGAARVALFLLADYQDFGVGAAFRVLLAARLLFLLVSASALLVLRRAASPAAADRLFLGWGLLFLAMTVCALAARPPDNTSLLLMSFVAVIVTYCVTPLPLPRQAALALTYTALALYVSRRADGATLSTVGAAYALSNLFGGVMSWRLNHRWREVFLAALREAELRASLEEALAEVRTLRGLLCICAWCKRIRDEAQTWQAVEQYVAGRTHAEFSHAICPDCLQSQRREVARLRR